MKERTLFLFIFLCLNLTLFPRLLSGQRLTISTWSGSEDISIRPIGMGSNGLNFNQLARVITANSNPIQIRKEDTQAAIFAIEAPSESEIVITLDYYPYLSKIGDATKGHLIPISLNMAYNNHNVANEAIAKNESIDLKNGITSLTIPVDPKFIPGRLPIGNEYGSTSQRPKSVVYLFIFGTLGPVGSISAGEYTTQINLHVHMANEKN